MRDRTLVVLSFFVISRGHFRELLVSRSKSSFGLPNDSATYRNLFLFEEHLKTNAANLQRRKSRYPCQWSDCNLIK
jgi:hypothetical protein